MQEFKPPGRLRLLLRWTGDQVYGLLISLGWQPREQGDGGKARKRG